MRMTKLYMPTLREVPSEAEIPSHQLLMRAGMIRKLVSGVYSYLPLGHRVLKKVEQIVREEMDASGSQEVLMSAIQPAELWQETSRWEDFGPEMFRLKDRSERQFCLGPTHEEIFTDLIRYEVNSYKQLPMNLYQIQTKYRDEKRPRFGLIRSREFLMKDAYSFDQDEAGMMNAYQEMWDAYDRIFTRLGMKYRVVEGDAGAMGNGDSHEFTAMCEVGESNVAYCDACDFAATDEKAQTIVPIPAQDSEEKNLEKVDTPDVGTIEDLEKFFGFSADRFMKTLLYIAKDRVVAACIPGHREINETKLLNALGVAEHDLEMADAETVKRVTSAEVGFAGPIGLDKDVEILVDSRVLEMKNFVIGANETDKHYINANYGRDFEGRVIDDLLTVRVGDACPKCGAPLVMDRGIEVGNIFQLGTKYSKPLSATYLDQNGKEQLIWMGSYGVGVSRSVAAIIEQNHDDFGIVWPAVVAPFHVVVTPINVKNDEQRELAEKLYEDLKNAGVEVLLDDRKERPGVKFKDAELIGFPIRVAVGRGAADKMVEYVLRRDMKNKEEITADDVVARVIEDLNKQGLNL